MGEDKKDEDYSQKATADTDDFIMGYEADDVIPEISAPKVIGEEEDLSGGFVLGIDDDDADSSIIAARRQKKEEKLMNEIDKLLADLDEQKKELNNKK